MNCSHFFICRESQIQISILSLNGRNFCLIAVKQNLTLGRSVKTHSFHRFTIFNHLSYVSSSVVLKMEIHSINFVGWSMNEHGTGKLSEKKMFVCACVVSTKSSIWIHVIAKSVYVCFRFVLLVIGFSELFDVHILSWLNYYFCNRALNAKHKQYFLIGKHFFFWKPTFVDVDDVNVYISDGLHIMHIGFFFFFCKYSLYSLSVIIICIDNFIQSVTLCLPVFSYARVLYRYQNRTTAPNEFFNKFRFDKVMAFYFRNPFYHNFFFFAQLPTI